MYSCGYTHLQTEDDSEAGRQAKITGLYAILGSFISLRESFNANDVKLRVKIIVAVVFYYADIALDIAQLHTFFLKSQFRYLGLNVLGIIAGFALDVVNGGCPLIGPAGTLFTVTWIPRILPKQPSMRELRSSESRLQSLKCASKYFERTGMMEAFVEGVASLLVQGFALSYEATYSAEERQSMALSITVSSVMLAKALMELDGDGRVHHEMQVHTHDGTSRVPIVIGSLPLLSQMKLLPLRWLEVVARLGSLVLPAVAFKLQLTEHAAWLATGMELVIAMASDLALCLTCGSPGSWRHFALGFLAFPGPVNYPCTAAVFGAPPLHFHALRAFQTTILVIATLACFEGNFSQLQSAFSADGRCAWLVLLIVGCPMILSVFSAPIAWALCPHAVPPKVVSAWAVHVGVAKRCFPEVDPQDRLRLVSMGLLPQELRTIAEPVHDSRRPDDADIATIRESVIPELRAVAPKLLALDFHCCSNESISAEAWGVFAAEVMTQMQRLQRLDLGFCALDAAKMRALVPGLRAVGPQLLELNLNYAGETSVEAWHILAVEALPQLQRLQDLQLQRGHLDDAKLRVLVPGLRAVAPQLVKLNLSYIGGNRGERDKYPISVGAWGLLAVEAMAHMKRLQDLSLACCYLDDAKIRVLVPGFRAVAAQLLKLRLDGNKSISAEGWGVLAAEAMPYMQSLQDLNLESCGIKEGGFLQLIPLLGQLSQSLRVLNLGRNELSSSVAWTRFAAEVLHPRCGIEHLTISEAVSIEDTARLVPAIVQVGGLQSFHVRDLQAKTEAVRRTSGLDSPQLEEPGQVPLPLPLPCQSESRFVQRLPEIEWDYLDKVVFELTVPSLVSFSGLQEIDPLCWRHAPVLIKSVLPHLKCLQEVHIMCGKKSNGLAWVDDEHFCLLAAALRTTGSQLIRLTLAKLGHISADSWCLLASQAMPQMTRLQDLDLHACEFNDAKLRVLVPGLQAVAPQLLKLNLSLSAEGWGVLAAQVMPQMQRLQDLTLNWSAIDNAKLRALVPGLCAVAPRLLMLGLTSKDISVESWGVLAAQVMPQMQRLQDLTLDWSALDDAKLHALVPGLRAVAPQLLRLTITDGGHTSISAETWDFLAAQAMPQMQRLQDLKLEACGLDVEKLRALVPIFRAVAPTLLKLDLSRNTNISAEGWGTLATETLPQMHQLQDLHLSGDMRNMKQIIGNLDDEKLRAFVPGLCAVAPQLLRLSLAGNVSISAEGWSILAAEAMPQMRRLQDLCLHLCALDDAKIRAIVPGLCVVARTLLKLGITNELISVEGWGVLAAEAMPQMQRLQELNLNRFHFKNLDDAKLEALVPGLRAVAPQLVKLNMNYNDEISAEGWSVLAAEVLPQMPNLQQLEVNWEGRSRNYATLEKLRSAVNAQCVVTYR